MHMKALDGKAVLVTGGTGSFGQHFIDAVLAKSKVKKLIVFSRDELKQSQMQARLKDARLRYFLGDVRDSDRLRRAFSGVDIVVHAAALKQVPALEYNPSEAIKTNTMGTQNVIDAALDAKVKKVLFVSTDKAVNPVNLYGATKLCAEKLIVAANAYRGSEDGTIFSAVRYGNVVGSRGSIVDVIKKQKETGTVLLTHADMTRFWLHLDGAIALVLGALANMRGGEIFLPKMNSSKVSDLLTLMAPECKVKTIGIRPGEKMHEMLLTDMEVLRTRDAGFAYVVEPDATHGWWKGSHLKKLPVLSKQFRYASDNPDILLSAKDAFKAIGIRVD